MASHIACIINILQSSLGSDIQGISPAPVPDNAQFPYITVSEIVSEDQESLDGDNGLEYSMIQVSVWSPDYEEADAIRAQAKKALTGYNGVVLGVSITGSNHDSNSEIYDPARELRQCVVRITLWFEDAAAESLKASYSDRFNRADSALLGANWLQYLQDTRYMQIASNALHIPYNLTLPTTVGRSIAVYNSVPSPDQFAELIIKSASLFSNGNSNTFGPMVRLSIDGLRGYELAVGASGSLGVNNINLNLFRIDDSIAKTGVVLWSIPSPVQALDGDVIRIEAKGSTITVKHNGQILASVSDSVYPTGYIGMGDVGIGLDTREYQFSGWNGGEL